MRVQFGIGGLLLSFFVKVDVSKSHWIESAFTLRMSKTVNQCPAIGVVGLVLQSIEHAAVLIVEELHDWSVSLLCLDLVIILFLKQVHGRCILIEISGQNHQILLSVVVRILKGVLLNELLHLLDLFVPCHEGLHIEWYTLSIVAGLEVGME